MCGSPQRKANVLELPGNNALRPFCSRPLAFGVHCGRTVRPVCSAPKSLDTPELSRKVSYMGGGGGGAASCEIRAHDLPLTERALCQLS